jgi:hypothetical protein
MRPGGADKLHAAFLNESRTLAAGWCYVQEIRVSQRRTKTYLASRADNKSKVASELVRAFMRKLSTLGMELWGTDGKFTPRFPAAGCPSNSVSFPSVPGYSTVTAYLFT